MQKNNCLEKQYTLADYINSPEESQRYHYEICYRTGTADPIFSFSFIPMAFNLIYTALMFSTKRTTQANAIAICRGIFIKAAAIFSIPFVFGGDAIWIAPFIAEITTLLLAIILSKRTKLTYQ